jgi:hypothetical protein
MSINAHHIPNAVHPFKVPVWIEGLLFQPIENPSGVNSIHQCAVLLLEKRNIKVGVKMKYNSISMEEFPEIAKEPMGGKSAKKDEGLGKDIPAKSDLDLNPDMPDGASILTCSLYPSDCSRWIFLLRASMLRFERARP